MKKITLLLCVFLVLTSFQSETKKADFNFVGKWIGIDENEEGGFIFDEGGYAFFVKGDAVIGGKGYDINGRKIDLKYVIDQNGTPIKLDIIMNDIASGDSRKRLFIAKIIDKDNIMLAQEEDGKRPTTFTKANSITLTRQ